MDYYQMYGGGILKLYSYMFISVSYCGRKFLWKEIISWPAMVQWSECVVFVSSEVGVGRSSTEPLRGGQLPKVLATEPWDGKDGEV